MRCMSVSRPRSIAALLIAASFCVMIAVSAAVADPAVASGSRSHTVQKGETLYAIAKRYDVSVAALMSLNGIADAGRLFVGMQLAIPGGSDTEPRRTR